MCGNKTGGQNVENPRGVSGFKDSKVKPWQLRGLPPRNGLL